MTIKGKLKARQQISRLGRCLLKVNFFFVHRPDLHQLLSDPSKNQNLLQNQNNINI